MDRNGSDGSLKRGNENDKTDRRPSKQLKLDSWISGSLTNSQSKLDSWISGSPTNGQSKLDSWISGSLTNGQSKWTLGYLVHQPTVNRVEGSRQ